MRRNQLGVSPQLWQANQKAYLYAELWVNMLLRDDKPSSSEPLEPA
jgi:hypothetical protein